MHSVVSVLDPASYALVETLWKNIEQEFGIKPDYAYPVPHFTYHVAEDYDPIRLRDALWHASRDHGPFRVHAQGLGLFTGRKLVVHVPLVRNGALNRLQRELWRDLDGVGRGVVQHFHPELWIPHVTLAHTGLTPELLPHVVGWLAEQSFAWDIEVDGLAVLHGTGHAPRPAGEDTTIGHRFDLVGRAPEEAGRGYHYLAQPR